MPTPFHRLFCILVVALFIAAPVAAATITGVVSDPDGRPIAGARVVVAASDVTVATAVTDPGGRYTVGALPAGRYTVLVLCDGFRAAPSDVQIAARDTREVPIAMSISALAETLVVSAAQVDVPFSRAADSITIIPEATLAARQIESVADALRAVPGLVTARSGGRGALTSIFPRGGDSDYTLVLIDGLKANAFGGGFDFSQLALGGVEQIEVVRGPQSALFGSDAIGGVVQLVTRHGGPPRLNGLFEYGGFDTTRSAASASGSLDPFTWSASGEGWRSDGFTGTAPATGERVSNDAGDLVEGGFGAGWTSARAGELRFDGRVSASDRGFPGPFGSNPIGAFGGVDRVSQGHRERRQVGVRYSTFLGASRRIRQRASVSRTALDGRFISAFDPDKPSTDATRRLNARVQTDVTLGTGVALTAGFEHTRERGESSFIEDASGNLAPIERAVTGYFAEVRVNRGARFFLTSGLRVEDIERKAVPADAFSRPTFPRESIVSPNPKLAVTYYLRPEGDATRGRGWTRARFTAGTGIRPPDAFEIAFTDNPSLKPERTKSVDAGVSQAFAGGALIVDATAFANRYDDLIVAVSGSQQDASRFRTDNISNARARGVELSATGRLPIGLDVQAGYTWLATKILPVDGASGAAPKPFVVGDPLIRRPRHQASFAATLTRGRATAYFELHGRGRTLDVEPNAGALFGGLFDNPGYVASHAGASVRLTREIDAYGRVQNLFDREYEEVFGYPALGRAATIGVRVALRR